MFFKLVLTTVFLSLLNSEGRLLAVEAEDIRLQLSEDVVTDGLADEDRIVLAGSDLSIECRFNVSISQHNASRIRWDIVRHFDDKSRQRKSALARLTVENTTINQDENVLTSVMTLRKVEVWDAGYFDCILDQDERSSLMPQQPSNILRQYIFVQSPDDEFYLIANAKFYRLKIGARNQLIRCKPSQPEITVKLYQTASPFNQQEMRREINVENPDSNWSYDKRQGYTIKQVTPSDAGIYQCEGSVQDFYTEYPTYVGTRINITISVIGVVLSSWNESIVRGKTATVACRTLNTGESRPQWIIKFGNNENETVVDGTSATHLLPNGNKISVTQLQNQLRYSESDVSMLTISNVTENFFVRCQVKDPIKSNEVYSSSSAHFQIIEEVFRHRQGHSEGNDPPVYGRVSPSADYQVVKRGSSFELSCTFDTVGYSDYLKWSSARNFSTLVTDEISTERFRIVHGSDTAEVKDSATLRVSNAVESDTGYYTCVLDWQPALTVRRFVFVYDPDTPSFVPTESERNVVRQGELQPHFVYRVRVGETVVIPCRPTQPDIEMTFFKDSNLDEKHYTPVEVESQGRWNYNHFDGLTILNVTTMDNGTYKCVAEQAGRSAKMRFAILVAGVTVNSVNTRPKESENVTLTCNSFRLGTTRPDWFVTYSKSGLLETADQEIKLDPKALPPDTEIKLTFNDHKEIYTSDLIITNITHNISGAYRCQVMNNNTQFSFFSSASISISVQRYSEIRASVLIGPSKSSNELQEQTFVVIVISAVVVILVILLITVVAFLLYRNRQKIVVHQSFAGVKQLLKGNRSAINPDLPIGDQSELLPYDKRWEFPRERLRLGIQLGAGNFGRVVKAEASGLNDNVPVKTVAVKMVRSQTNVLALEALVSELKILIHLGAHLNIVNLLGACTKNLYKSDLLVIVEYCRFGNLQSYLINNRNGFINQIKDDGQLQSTSSSNLNRKKRNDEGGYRIKKDNRMEGIDEIDGQREVRFCIEEEVESICSQEGTDDRSSISSISMQQDFPQENYENIVESHSITTNDLICWSFQIARGMEYLSSKKVLHGDLAARNILLSDDGVVKVADFGMARQMVNYVNYQKATGQGLMPIKWMAIESLTDCTFSTQSDVWSYGVLLWELFSLAQMPYPGMEADNKFIRKLKDGYRMDKPPFAPKIIGDLMVECWKQHPKERPTFRHLMDTIGAQLDPVISNHYIQLNEPYIKTNMEKTANDSQSDYYTQMTRTLSSAHGFFLRSFNSLVTLQSASTTAKSANMNLSFNKDPTPASGIPTIEMSDCSSSSISADDGDARRSIV